eukprot:g4047.t1
MVLVDPDVFLHKVQNFFQSSRNGGSVTLTMKRHWGRRVGPRSLRLKPKTVSSTASTSTLSSAASSTKPRLDLSELDEEIDLMSEDPSKVGPLQDNSLPMNERMVLVRATLHLMPSKKENHNDASSSSSVASKKRKETEEPLNQPATKKAKKSLTALVKKRNEKARRAKKKKLSTFVNASEFESFSRKYQNLCHLYYDGLIKMKRVKKKKAKKGNKKKASGSSVSGV